MVCSLLVSEPVRQLLVRELVMRELVTGQLLARSLLVARELGMRQLVVGETSCVRSRVPRLCGGHRNGVAIAPGAADREPAR